MKAFLVWGNLAFCGFIMMNITMFFVGGTIGENYDNEMFVAPQFFWIVPVWLLGAMLVGWFFYNNKVKNTSYDKILLINLLLWTTIPIGLWFSNLFY